ncbi:Hypothetical protein PHPALM_5591 [Phytophthora palmivora]|uniref:Uncharacterized protein n=1 Tax=Phytophthora palmivora TaxID=4796 RepID=A0A2P4YGZ0_9STRA|nr:Hypothetical protein PHPALM_5591 [Phytophthora palmivora]
MENGPDVHVMDAVWQLLEALDGHRMHDSKSGYHRRHVPLPAPIHVQPLQPQPQQVVSQRVDIVNLVISTETITGVYRRIPILAKLFAALTDTSLGAAGVDTAGGGMSKIVSNYGKRARCTILCHEEDSKEKVSDPLPVSSKVPLTTEGENVREDVEAMSLLLVKISKFVRSLAPLVDSDDSAHTSMSASDNVLTIMDLATKLEDASALTESPTALKGGGGGKRRLSLAADREVPVLLAVQSLARSNDFSVVSKLIATSVEAKMTRVRTAVAEAEVDDEDDDDDDDDSVVVMEGDEEVLKIVKNLRRASAKSAQIPEVQDQKQVQIQGGGGQNASRDGDPTPLRSGKGDIQASIKNAAALRGVKLFSVDILLRIVNQLYRDNYESMVSTLQYGNRRMEFSEFIYDWHIRKYGLKTLAQRHLLKLIQSLRKHEKKSFQCQL